ncbi:32272_t:CDS:1, partial [Gigaspora margarita]
SLPETREGYQTKSATRLYQYAIEHKMDPEKFSIITKAEKNR